MHMVSTKGNLHLFRTDPDKSRRGTPIELEGGVRVFIARARIRLWRARVRELLEPHRKELRAGTLPLDVLTRIEGEAAADTLIRGWEGLTDDDGDVVPYSPEKARELMTDPRYERFQDLIIGEAEHLENFRAEVGEQSLGNSSGACAGDSSSGATESQQTS